VEAEIILSTPVKIIGTRANREFAAASFVMFKVIADLGRQLVY